MSGRDPGRTEFAPAKINLTLQVLGRRADGYHALQSLVVFARDVGDRISASPSDKDTLTCDGTFASQLVGDNVVTRAVQLVRTFAPHLPPLAIKLTKLLPVASGIGGGSADAGAVLRLLKALSLEAVADGNALSANSDAAWVAAAHTLGADVPVCFLNSAAMMTGAGEHVTALKVPSDMFAVVANPCVAVPSDKTAQVFRRLNAPLIEHSEPSRAADEPSPFEIRDSNAVLDYVLRGRNDLQAPALQLVPQISDVLDALQALPGCRLARLSGAGPTCFALFETLDVARCGAEQLAHDHPSWWVRATLLG